MLPGAGVVEAEDGAHRRELERKYEEAFANQIKVNIPLSPATQEKVDERENRPCWPDGSTPPGGDRPCDPRDPPPTSAIPKDKAKGKAPRDKGPKEMQKSEAPQDTK